VRARGPRARARPGRDAAIDPGGASTGQATVELALALPLVMTLLLLIVQVALVGRDQVLVVHAAREAARAAAVQPNGDRAGPAAAAAAAGPLDPSRLDVDVADADGTASSVRAHVRYRARTEVPLIGLLLPDVTLEATAVMRRE